MGYAPRGFDHMLFLLLIICCLPCVYGEGGFCWKYGSQGQNCNTVCTSVALVCVKKFDKVGSEDDFKAAGDGGVGCSAYYGVSWSRAPNKYSDGGSEWDSYLNAPGRPCYYQTGSGSEWDSCTTSNSDDTRLCSCQCAAGTYSTTDLKRYPCDGHQDHFIGDYQ